MYADAQTGVRPTSATVESNMAADGGREDWNQQTKPAKLSEVWKSGEGKGLNWTIY